MTAILAVVALAAAGPGAATVHADTFGWDTLVDGQHLAFTPGTDQVSFSNPAVAAAAVGVQEAGGDVGLTYDGKTVWLDGISLGQLAIQPAPSVLFASGSVIIIGDGTTATGPDALGQVWDQSHPLGDYFDGLRGADDMRGGFTSNDVFVGNPALDALDHVSRLGSNGSPTGSRMPTISGDGRYAAFTGGWTGFGSSSNSATDVLVKDLAGGIVNNEHQSGTGQLGNSGADGMVISGDGSSTAFHSASSNLVSGASSGALYDVYVSEVTGPGIVRASTGTGGTPAADGRNQNPDISVDGRRVVFESTTTSWIPGSSGTQTDVLVKDLDTGVLERVSTSLAGNDGDGESTAPRISGDGRWVVFQSAATNLTANDTNGATDIFLWDGDTATLTNLTGALPGSNPGAPATAPDIVYGQVDGSLTVVFQTARGLWWGDTNGAVDVYRLSVPGGLLGLVSSTAASAGVSLGSEQPSISGDGRFVTFTSYSDALVPGDTNGSRDIFVKDLRTGAITLVSKAADGTAGNQASTNPSISLGGDWVVFESAASNLAATDANGTFADVFRGPNPLLVDRLFGRGGDDTYRLARADYVAEEPNKGTDTIEASFSATVPVNVENLVLTGTADINGTGNAANNVITGNPGANTLTGNGGDDTLDGGGGDYDQLYGGTGDDTYILRGPGGIMSETGGSGTDTVRAPVTVTLLPTLENLVLTGTAAIDGTGNAADNVIIGNAAANILTGNGGDDTLDGGDGVNDYLRGGAGDDTYIVNASADIIQEPAASGTDTVRSSVSWTLGGTLENLVLTGTTDIFGSGNGASNVVTGNLGVNQLSGGAGSDTLDGGPGSDTLTGGSGADSFRLSSLAGSDTVRDFASGTDRVKVDMSAIRIGDGDTRVENAVTRSSPGGFSRSAELVIFKKSLSGTSPTAAARAIGSATKAYTRGSKRLFVVRSGTTTAVYRFVASSANAGVSASELTLLAKLVGSSGTVIADYRFVP